jgi:hypothetical protein
LLILTVPHSPSASQWPPIGTVPIWQWGVLLVYVPVHSEAAMGRMQNPAHGRCPAGHSYGGNGGGGKGGGGSSGGGDFGGMQYSFGVLSMHVSPPEPASSAHVTYTAELPLPDTT